MSKTKINRFPGRMTNSAVRAGLVLVVCFAASAIALGQAPDQRTIQDPVNPIARFLPKQEKMTTPPIGVPIKPGTELVSPSNTAGGGTKKITLTEAQQAAAAQADPKARFAELEIEVAKEGRKIAEASYYPAVSATFANMHFNKFMGERIRLGTPDIGVNLAIPLLTKDSTTFNVNVTQPLTPLLKIQQVVKIARADENIAKAKAGVPLAELSMNVEKSYFDLLIAQRELTIAQAKANSLIDKVRDSGPSAAERLEMVEAQKSVSLIDSKVRKLSAILSNMMGLPIDTELGLVIPPSEKRSVTLAEATQQAMDSNPEIYEAEQTAIKAGAGKRLAQLDYIPDVAVIAGYANENIIQILPRDFTYVGILATYSIFDGFKREHTYKMRKAQVEMAEMGVGAAKAKVSANVKTSYFKMEESRRLRELAQRMISASNFVNTSSDSESAPMRLVRAGMELELLRAEQSYREAYGELLALMGDN